MNANDPRIQSANGRRRERIITNSDVELFNETVAANPEAREVRVYGGFVPNAYKWRADTTVLIARRNQETGEMEETVTTTDAKRPYGKQSRVTVNGRAA